MSRSESMNRRQLAGKVAILPGASRSLGLHVARLLLDRGARVVICDVQPELNSDAAAFLQQSDRSSPFLYIPCDLACPDQIKNSFKKAIESFGRLDIVVNSLGIAYERGRAWPRVVDINFISYLDSSYIGIELMSKENGRDGGTIINIGSTTALKPSPLLPVYSSTKAAINQFSRSLGSDYHFKKTGVRVIAINPDVMNEDYLFHSDNFLIDDVSTAGWRQPTLPLHVAALGVMRVLQNANSGSVWAITGGESPKIEDITENFILL